MRARVASGAVEIESIEKARSAFAEWLSSDLEFTEAAVYTAEEIDLRRALKMGA